MSVNYIGIDVFLERSFAEQVAQQYRIQDPPRKNIKVIETGRINLYDCPTDLNSCVKEYDKSGTPLYVVYSEMQ